jgi:tetratricopeptide (TPR) repeat protein
MRWPYYRGHVRLALHDAEAAAAFFEQSHRLDLRQPAPLIWLAETDLMLGRPADAERHSSAAVDLAPTSVPAWFRRGRAAVAMRDYQHGVQYLERALSLGSDADPIHYQLGLAYRGLGDSSRAAAHLARHGDADGSIVPDDPLLDSLRTSLNGSGAYLNRGVEALERRDWPTAIENLREATRLSPRDAGAQLNLGTALFLSGDRPGARSAFEAAIRAAPDLPKPRYTLGLLAENEGRDGEAIEQFTTAVRLDTNYVEAHASLADALRRSGRVQESLQHYAIVLTANPAASQMRFGYAMGLVRLGRFVEARDWLKEAVRLHPEQPGFSHALARVLAAAPDDRVRDGREAARLVDALMQSNTNWTLLETRAMAAAELGQFEEAIRLQQAALAAAAQGQQKRAVAHMQTILARYRLGLPCRTPWSPDDPVFAPRPTT